MAGEEPSVKHVNHKWSEVGDGLMVGFSTPGPIAEEVWDAFVADLKNKPVKKYLATVVGSTSINSLQRSSASKVLNAKKIEVAVITDEMMVRGLVTAVSWLGVHIKSFSWAEAREAIRHLRVSPAIEEKTLEAVMKFRASYKAA